MPSLDFDRMRRIGADLIFCCHKRTVYPKKVGMVQKFLKFADLKFRDGIGLQMNLHVGPALRTPDEMGR